MRNLIKTQYCYDEYSAFNREKNDFGFYWTTFNSSYSANLSFSNLYSSFQYTESSQINSYPYSGEINSYLGGGYLFKMIGDSANMLKSTQQLKDLRWLDKQTSALFIEFTLFNPNVNLFQYCSILFEIIPSGHFVKSAQFYPIDLLDLNNNSGLLSFKILLNIIYLIFIVIFMIVEIKHLNKMRLRYFMDFNNYIELFIIGFSWAAFSMYIYRLYASYEIYDKIKQNTLINIHINLQYVSNCDHLLSYFLGFCTAFGSLRFIKLLRFNKRIIVFLHAFKLSLKEMASFGICFFIVWMGFVQMFYTLYNDKFSEFATIPNAIETCFQMILGRGSAIFINNGSFNLIGIVLYVLFVVCIIFVMINIFLTIMNDNYAMARIDQSLDKDDPELFTYLKSLIQSVFFCFKQNKSHAEPPYADFWDTLPIRFDHFLAIFQNVIIKISLKNIFYILNYIINDLFLFYKVSKEKIKTKTI